MKKARANTRIISKNPRNTNTEFHPKLQGHFTIIHESDVEFPAILWYNEEKRRYTAMNSPNKENGLIPTQSQEMLINLLRPQCDHQALRQRQAHDVVGGAVQRNENAVLLRPQGDSNEIRGAQHRVQPPQ